MTILGDVSILTRQGCSGEFKIKCFDVGGNELDEVGRWALGHLETVDEYLSATGHGGIPHSDVCCAVSITNSSQVSRRGSAYTVKRKAGGLVA